MRRVLAGLALLTMLATAPSTAAAEPASHAPPERAGLAAAVDDVVEKKLADDHIPGAVVTVVADGRTVLAKGYGRADVARDVAMDPSRTTFAAASEAKVVTAVAAAQLVADGRIDPDADVNTYLRAFQVEDTFPGQPVTLNHLLTHTAGFDKDYVGLNSADSTGIESLGRSLADKQPIRVRPPGEAMAYDNYGFALAGYLVEVVSGQPFDEYVAEHVLAPLGMTGTTFTQPTPTRQAEHLAKGYRPDGDGYVVAKGQYGPWTPTGGGTLTSAADMTRLMRALLDDDPRLGKGVAKLVKQQHHRSDPRAPGVGYALVESSWGGERVLGKDADLPGFHHDMALVPDRGIGVFVGFNGDGVGGAAYWDAKVVRDTVLDHLLPRRAADAHEPVPGDVSGYAGSYRQTTTSLYSLMKVTAMTTPVRVEAAGDGRLTTTGISDDPAKHTQRWTHLGDGEFAEVGGQERIVFTGDGTLIGGRTSPEATEYQPIAWYQDPTLHQALLGVGVLGLALGFCWFPLLALVRRKRARPAFPARLARVVAWLNCALGMAFVTGFVLLVADGNALIEAATAGSWLLTVVPYVAAATLVTTSTMVVLLVTGIRRRWWRPRAWVGHTALTVAAVLFLGVCLYYDLVALGDLVSPGGFQAS